MKRWWVLGLLLILNGGPNLGTTHYSSSSALQRIGTLLDQPESTERSALDSLLATCPTKEEVDEIFADFKIHIPDKFTPHCEPADQEDSAVVLSLVNALRLMKQLAFSKPLPLIDHANLYEWFRSLNLSIHIVTGEGKTEATEEDIYLNARYLAHPDNRHFVSALDEAGTAFVIGLLLHEARHTIPGGGVRHNCDKTRDSTIAYGGAWGLQFYYYYWLSNYTSDLNEAEKKRANELAVNLVLTHICQIN